MIDIQNINVFDHFLICVDAEELTIHEKEQELTNYICGLGINLGKTETHIIIQNRCFETWFLGNRRAFPRHPQNDFIPFHQFYDVSEEDPELMLKDNEQGTIAQYHSNYFKAMMREKNCRYSKENPGVVCDRTYLEQLITRVRNTDHLPTFKKFLNVCDRIYVPE